MKSVQHFSKINDYCKAIGISEPLDPDFDIRTFQQNMATIVAEMPPFRHEFYAIALKLKGSGIAISGHHKNFPKGSTIFFNSPFQILSWDIKPDWEGFYIMFSQDFIAKSNYLQDILKNFGFLKIEKTIPFEIHPEDITEIQTVYESIYREYHSNHSDKFLMIESFVLLLLNFVKRYFRRNISQQDAISEIRKTDVKILARFQASIETHFYPNAKYEGVSSLHSTSFYAQKLGIHPNHLNAVVKQITGITAKQHIQRHILNLAKSRLLQTKDSIKEIAYGLFFDSPNHFNVFFKKHTSQTPTTFRKGSKL